MSLIAFRKSAWESATAKQRMAMKLASEKLQIGEPARYTFNGNEWFVSEDSRFDFNDARWLVGLALSASEIQAYDTADKDNATIRAELRAIIAGNRPDVAEWEDLQAASPNYLKVGVGLSGFAVSSI